MPILPACVATKLGYIRAAQCRAASNTRLSKLMGTYKFTVSYDGREYFGWQRHKDKPTIQGAIEGALADLVGTPVLVNGSGRTDRGAHALGQVFSADLDLDLGHDSESAQQELAAFVVELNARLPDAIKIDDAAAAAPGFHARHSATGKVYRYELFSGPKCPDELQGRVWHVQRPLQVEPMREALKLFVGEMDFASFATKPNFKQKSTRKHLRRAELVHEGPRISIVLEADGFLYKMVRNIVRAVVKVGEGRSDPAKLRGILDARDRKAAPGTAPASGLFLDAVRYE